MKKIYLIMLTVFLNMALFSCTSTGVSEDSATATEQQQSCCEGKGGDSPINPPPPTKN